MDHNERQQKIEQLKNDLALMDKNHPDYDNTKKMLEESELEDYKSLTPWDRVLIARKQTRPKASDYIKAIFTDFIELHGDQLFSDDASIIGGLGYLDNIPVTIIAHSKGKTLEENIKMNFGSTNPEGFRKAIRLANQASKFNRPIITFVDTSGAYPGKGAEERGQARAIAEALKCFGDVSSPIIAVVIGEGGSGGALALSLGNKIVMLENAIYSVLSPEGYASILYKDTKRVIESANKMKLTSFDLEKLKIVDKIIIEGKKGIEDRFSDITNEIKEYLIKELTKYKKMNEVDIKEERYQKYRHLGDLSL